MKNNKTKGDILEEIIEKMYSEKGLIVQRNVYVPPINTTNIPRKKREIDILITGKIAGINIKIAIECKNEKEIIGSPKIDAFIGKLNDINIPSQLGIFISTKGFTKGALGRAKQAGIKTLILKNLNPDCLTDIKEASHSVIQLLLCINDFSIFSDVYRYENEEQTFNFFDENKNYAGNLFDIIWLNWNKNKFPDTIGLYKHKIYAPDNWFQLVNDSLVKIRHIEVNAVVLGLVFGFSGYAEDLILVDAEKNVLEKRKINAKFNSQPNLIFTVKTENELSDKLKLLAQDKKLTLKLGRFKISRIWMANMYYPASDNAVKILKNLDNIPYEKDKLKIAAEIMKQINGCAIDKAWMPICKENQKFYDNLLKEKI